jgi:glycosyltransferase involved in cell wall biosynthesis
LLVVDWSEGAAQELQARLERLHGLHGRAADAGDWEVLNCPATPLAAGPGRSAAARLGRTLKYLGTACTAAWRSRRYGQVVVWQQAIGYLMCLLPRWPQWLCAADHGAEALRPRLVITTVLMSPSSLPPHSLRRAMLRLALWRADALVYFSREMAQDTARHHPSQAHKVFWTPLPQLDAGLPKAQVSRPGSARLSVFAGGSSERDFDVVISAFSDGEVPVTLVCREDEVLALPGSGAAHFSVHREVSHARFDALVLQTDVAVVALKSSSSGCGQLLFTFCMRHGIAVIATDCYGTRDYVVPEETGLLVPAGDAAALRSAYDRLTADPALRSRLTQQARARSTHWGLATFVESIEGIGQTLHTPK